MNACRGPCSAAVVPVVVCGVALVVTLAFVAPHIRILHRRQEYVLPYPAPPPALCGGAAAIDAVAGFNPQTQRVANWPVMASGVSSVDPGALGRTDAEWARVFSGTRYGTKLFGNDTGVMSFSNSPNETRRSEEGDIVWANPRDGADGCEALQLMAYGEGAAAWDVLFAPDGERHRYLRVHLHSKRGFNGASEAALLMPRGLPLDSVTQLSLYISDPSVMTNLHYDSNPGFVYQLAGEKRVVVAPPHRVRALYGSGSRCARRSADYKGRIPAEEARAFGAWDFVLKQGDLAYIPRGYWHMLENPSKTKRSTSAIIRLDPTKHPQDTA